MRCLEEDPKAFSIRRHEWREASYKSVRWFRVVEDEEGRSMQKCHGPDRGSAAQRDGTAANARAIRTVDANAPRAGPGRAHERGRGGGAGFPKTLTPG